MKPRQDKIDDFEEIEEMVHKPKPVA